MPRGKPKRERRVRQQGTGSVYFNTGRDRWQCVIEMPPKEDGGRNRKVYTARATGDTPEGKAEVEARLAQWQGEYLTGTLKAPSRETTEGYLREWATTQAALIWGERHGAEVPRKLELYVYPVIGKVRLNDLSAAHVRRVLATMARTESRRKRLLSKQTMLHVYRSLHAALGRRIEWDEVQAPTVKRRPARLPEPETVGALLTEAVQERYGLVFVIMAATAMRPGEVLGLRRADLDLDGGTLSVTEAIVTRGKAKGSAKEAKTEESHRTLSLPDDLVALLRSYCEEWAALQLRTGRVFCTDAGGTPTIDALYAAWKRILKQSGVDYFKPYDLRHFAASYWLDEGIPLAQVSAALGHSSQTTTARVYSHKLRRSESRIAQASGKLLEMGKAPNAQAE